MYGQHYRPKVVPYKITYFIKKKGQKLNRSINIKKIFYNLQEARQKRIYKSNGNVKYISNSLKREVLDQE